MADGYIKQGTGTEKPQRPFCNVINEPENRRRTSPRRGAALRSRVRLPVPIVVTSRPRIRVRILARNLRGMEPRAKLVRGWHPHQLRAERRVQFHRQRGRVWLRSGRRSRACRARDSDGVVRPRSREQRRIRILQALQASLQCEVRVHYALVLLRSAKWRDAR